MLLLRIVCPQGLSDGVVDLLRSTPGVGRIVHIPGAEVDEGMDLVQTEIRNVVSDSLVADLAALDGWADGEVTLTSVGEIERVRFANGSAIPDAGGQDDMGTRQIRSTLSRLVRFDYQYVLLMIMAALIAAVGLIADLPIAIVGAMAFSPDLGRLNAMGFAILIKDGGLLLHGTRSLAAGILVAIALSAVGTLLLVLVGATDEPLAGIPDRLRDFVSVLDGFTVTVAFAAGVAAMVVFVADRGRAAVGVGVSITTIPAAAYVGISLAAGAWTEAGNAATVLLVNMICVVAAEVITGFVLRNHLSLGSGQKPVASPRRY